MGYQGAQHEYHSIQPKRRPQGGFLTPRDLERNHKVSSDRVLVENYFARMCSLWKAMSVTYKWNESKFDQVSRICCALTNAHVLWMPLQKGVALKHNIVLDARDILKQPHLNLTVVGQLV
ncbi:hypothetical protein H310_12184, partial [Aphanomyces invadans]